VQAVELENIPAHSFSAIVNCTSAGMTGSDAQSVDPLPILFEIKSGTVVMDTVYRPRETPLLRRARVAGAVIVDGTEMFLRQAALQFELFTKNQIVSDTATDNVPHKNADSNTNSRIGVSPNIHLQLNEQCLKAPIELWRKLLNHTLDAHS
jgi:shikimate 5-dehydrogenase